MTLALEISQHLVLNALLLNPFSDVQDIMDEFSNPENDLDGKGNYEE